MREFRKSLLHVILLGAGVLSLIAVGAPAAELTKIKVGVLKVSACGPLMIAQERGYFAQEGLEAQLVFMDQATLVPEGVRAGQFDFGMAAVSAAFFNTAGNGAMRIIAGDSDESPGFHGLVVVASNKAYDGGLKTLKDLAGHSFAITSAGTLQQYDLGLIADKYGFPYASMKMVPTGSFANMVSAVVGNSADAAFPPVSVSRPALAGGKFHNLAWIGDEISVQIAVVMTSAKHADQDPALVKRFLAVFRRGAKEFHDAFTGPDERPLDGPTAPEIYAILAKYTEVPVETMKLGLVHMDADGRLNVADVMHQVEWYKAQGMVKPEVDGTKIVDKRYVTALPGM